MGKILKWGNFADDSLLENQNRPSEDVLLHYLKSRNGVHGLGYEGLKFSSILCQDRRLESALKLKAKSKGIRGQVCFFIFHK